MKNANEIKFHASGMLPIMTGVKTNLSVEKSATCKKELRKIFNYAVWGRREEKENRYCEKGTAQEAESFQLLSRVLKGIFTKQEVRKSNDYFTCITDCRMESFLDQNEFTIDIKSSWSLDTFSEAMDSNIKDTYLYQGQVQMDVEKVNLHWLVYALVNNTGRLIENEIRKLQYKMEPGSLPWENAAIQIEKNHIFEMDLFRRNNPDYNHILPPDMWEYDIPIEDRIYKFEFNRDQEIIDSMKSRIDDCRTYMNNTFFKTETDGKI